MWEQYGKLLTSRGQFVLFYRIKKIQLSKIQLFGEMYAMPHAQDKYANNFVRVRVKRRGFDAS